MNSVLTRFGSLQASLESGKNSHTQISKWYQCSDVITILSVNKKNNNADREPNDRAIALNVPWKQTPFHTFALSA